MNKEIKHIEDPRIGGAKLIMKESQFESNFSRMSTGHNDKYVPEPLKVLKKASILKKVSLNPDDDDSALSEGRS